MTELTNFLTDNIASSIALSATLLFVIWGCTKSRTWKGRLRFILTLMCIPTSAASIHYTHELWKAFPRDSDFAYLIMAGTIILFNILLLFLILKGLIEWIKEISKK